MGMKPRTVLIVMVAFKYDFENCPREAKAIAYATGFRCKAAMHSKRQIAYIVEADISAAELMQRIQPAVQAGCVENAWCFTPAPDVASREPIDPLRERVAEAWASVHKHNRAAIRTAPKPARDYAAAAEAERERALRSIEREDRYDDYLPRRRSRQAVGAAFR